MSILKNEWWPEKYRPTSLEDYIGNEDFIKKMHHWIDNDSPINMILYSEKSGTGKSAACKLIANSLDSDILYINASEQNGIDVVRDKIKSFAMSAGFSRWKIVILEEFSQFSLNAQSALLNIIESSSDKTRYFLTGNYIEKFLPAIVSRCTPFQIQTPPIKVVCKNIASILKKENVEFDVMDVVRVVEHFYPDQRAMINYCQANSFTGALIWTKQDLIVNDYCMKIVEELKIIKDVKSTFQNIRQIIADSKVRQFDDLFRYLYDTLEDWVPDGKRAGIILTIADYQFKSNQVLDKEIQVSAMIINILKEIKG